MKKIGLLTDSTADIPKEIREANDIHVIPLAVIHGENSYLDGVDLSTEEFYDLLINSETLPKSSQPSPGNFLDIYKKLLNDYNEIISIHISTGLSGTVNAAKQAQEILKEKIHVIDSKSISVGTGLQVLEAAKAIREGLSADEIVAQIEHSKKNMEAMFTLDTLEYLYKGGRIGKVSNIMGSLLNIKPVVKVEDGIYVPFAKVRSRNNALNKIVSAFEEFANGRKVKSFGVVHGMDLPGAVKVTEALENSFNMKASIVTQVGSVVGVHTGPGTLGAAISFE